MEAIRKKKHSLGPQSHSTELRMVLKKYHLVFSHFLLEYQNYCVIPGDFATLRGGSGATRLHPPLRFAKPWISHKILIPVKNAKKLAGISLIPVFFYTRQKKSRPLQSSFLDLGGGNLGANYFKKSSTITKKGFLKIKKSILHKF